MDEEEEDSEADTVFQEVEDTVEVDTDREEELERGDSSRWVEDTTTLPTLVAEGEYQGKIGY